MSNEDNQEMENKHSQGNWNFLLAIVLISIVGFAAIIIFQDNNISNNLNNQIRTPQQNGDELVISVSSLGTEANFYAYSDGVKIKFFAVIGSDNEVHVAFDACDVCYSGKQGYQQNDNLMVCNNCGNQFSIVGIGTENLQGGCWPSYLPTTVAEGEVHIKISDVVSKKYMFE